MPSDIDMDADFGISREVLEAFRGTSSAPSAEDGAGEPAPGDNATQPSTVEGGQGGQVAVEEPEPTSQPGGPGPAEVSEDPVTKAARLERELAAANGQLQVYQQQYNRPQPGQEPQQPQAGGRKSVQERTPNYQLSVPAQIIEGVASQDPATRASALQQFASGIARTVHQQVLTQMDALEDSFPERAQSVYQVLNYQNAIFQDFYGNYTRLNDPSFHGLVKTVGAEYFATQQDKSWNQKARDEIAKRVYARLGWPYTPPGQTQRPAAGAPRVANGATAGATRPGGPAAGSLEAQVNDLVFGG